MAEFRERRAAPAQARPKTEVAAPGAPAASNRRLAPQADATRSDAPIDAAFRPAAAAEPTIFHITHWKAGSQWIHRILIGCLPNRIVVPEPDMSQVLEQPIRQGCVYPSVYLTRQRLEQVELPPDSRRFVVIRDLRDTLISLYFSMKTSHPRLAPVIDERRARLKAVDVEEGLVYLMDNGLPGCARIQASWLGSAEPPIRYEDLLAHDLEILERELLDRCALPVDRKRFEEVVLASRFERVTGRERGQEDQSRHERKGIAGDWRSYFTPRVKEEFKTRYGALLVESGYEWDLDW
jgi:Sulfotransferase domain